MSKDNILLGGNRAVYTESYPIEQLNQLDFHVELGGTYRPADCEPCQKIAIIIPFRYCAKLCVKLCSGESYRVYRTKNIARCCTIVPSLKISAIEASVLHING